MDHSWNVLQGVQQTRQELSVLSWANGFSSWPFPLVSRTIFVTFYVCSHSTEARNICFCLSLYQQWNSILSSCLIPTYPVQSSCVLKGWLYSLLLYDFTKLLLPAFEAGKSWPKLSDPCCKPHSGQDLSQSHHQDSSLPFTSIRILPAPSCNWKKFMLAQQIFRALWRYAPGCEPVQVDLRVFVLVEVFENKQEDREA